MSTDHKTAQQRFDAQYVSSAEIASTLKVSRTTILSARRRGLLPEPIVVNDGQVYIFERSVVAPYLDAWKRILDVRRGNVAVA